MKHLTLVIGVLTLFIIGLTGCAVAKVKSPTILIMAEDADGGQIREVGGYF